jgi:hypothetical protein
VPLVPVRLPVGAVDRHVPASVRVEVLDLLSELELLDTDSESGRGSRSGDESGPERSRGGGGADRVDAGAQRSAR